MNRATSLVRFTVPLRPYADALVNRYSGRKEAGIVIGPATDVSSIRLSSRDRKARFTDDAIKASKGVYRDSTVLLKHPWRSIRVVRSNIEQLVWTV